MESNYSNYIEIIPEELLLITCEYLRSDMLKLSEAYKDNPFIKNIINKVIDNVKSGNINPDIYFELKEVDFNVENLIFRFKHLIGIWNINKNYPKGIIETVNEHLEYSTMFDLLKKLGNKYYALDKGEYGSRNLRFISMVNDYYVYIDVDSNISFEGIQSVGYSKNWKEFYNLLINERLDQFLLHQQKYI